MKTLVALCLFLVSLWVGAQNVSVMGAQSCSKWTAEREVFASYYRNLGWATGFLSGMAVATRIDVLGPADGESIALWINNYCSANPLARMDTALSVLFGELSKRK